MNRHDKLKKLIAVSAGTTVAMSLLCVLLLYYVNTAIAGRMMFTGITAEIGYSSEIRYSGETSPDTCVDGTRSEACSGNGNNGNDGGVSGGGDDSISVSCSINSGANEGGNYDKLLQIADYLKKKDAALGSRALKLITGRVTDDAKGADENFKADLLSIEKMNSRDIAAITPIVLKIGKDGLSKISGMSKDGVTPDELYEIITMLEKILSKPDFLKITGIFLENLIND